MGRTKRNKPRRDDWAAPGMTVHPVRTVQDAMAALYGPGPASDDWRADVLGKRLSLRLGPDGRLMVNGHPLTREMCAALQDERPNEAEHLAFDTLQAMGRTLFPGLEMRRAAPSTSPVTER